MATAIGNICRAATRPPGSKLNILTFPTHERYETGLAKTGHNFFAWRADGVKEWNTSYAPHPSNYVLLNKQLGWGQLPLDVDLDLVLCQNKFGQFPIAYKISRELQVPLVCLEHTLPMPEWLGRLNQFKDMQGDVNVFISEYSREKWGWEPNQAEVIHHGIDTEVFSPGLYQPKGIHVLSIVNDFANRDWCCGFKLWQIVTQGLPVRLMGDNPGVSKPAASIEELISAYRQARVFLNTSLISPVPTVLLEAMACGCAVVSTDTCMIPEIIKDGYNGFICNGEKEMRKRIEELLEDEGLGIQLGKVARETICSRFPLNRFVKKWDDLLQKAANTPYIGDADEVESLTR
jgi:glycosyltransferase involved in cell wall biosynthesis